MYEHNGYVMLDFYDNERIRIYEHQLNALIENSLHDVLNNHVHHKNGIKFDNRVENLEVMSNSNHRSLHMAGNKHSRFNHCIKIHKRKHKKCKQGFTWVAYPYTNDKRINISSTNLNKCKEKVEEFIKSEENNYGYTNYKVII